MAKQGRPNKLPFKQERSEAQQLLCDISDYLKFKQDKKLPESFKPKIEGIIEDLKTQRSQTPYESQASHISGHESKEVEDMILDLNRVITHSHGKVPANVRGKITEIGAKLAPHALNLYR